MIGDVAMHAHFIYCRLPTAADSDYATIDDGIVNPLYMHHTQEPMAASSEIEREDQVLTTDSWLKEMAKGTDA